jgi:hypothetical protein
VAPRAPRPSGHPRHRERPGAARRPQPRNEHVEIVDALALAPDPGRRDALELDLDLEDVTGESHSTQRRAEELGLALLGHLQHAIVRDAHAQRADVLAEAAHHVVVLAVHVARHHAAERHVLGSRIDGRRPAARREEGVELPQREARLGAQHAALGIEAEDPVRQARPRAGSRRRRRQRGIAVGAPEAATQRRAPARALQVFGEPLLTGRDRVTPPARELLHRPFHRMALARLDAAKGSRRSSRVGPWLSRSVASRPKSRTPSSGAIGAELIPSIGAGPRGASRVRPGPAAAGGPCPARARRSSARCRSRDRGW